MLKELSYAVQQSFSLLNGLNHKDFSYKPDGSIVTSADKIIEKHLIKQIKILDPKGLIISEESEFNNKEFIAQRYWLIDPIDGTNSYFAGKKEFTVNIALIYKGMPALGIIGHPPTNSIWCGDINGAFFFRNNIKRKIVNKFSLRKKKLNFITSRNINEKTKEFLRCFKFDSHLKESSSIKFCRIAEGKADIYPRLQKINKWDIAAGDAILRAAGGVTINTSGKIITYNSQTNLVEHFISIANIEIWHNLIQNALKKNRFL